MWPQGAQVEPAGGLDGVGVEQGAGRAVPDGGGDGGEVVDRSHLVVDRHHADHCHVRTERGGERVEVDPSALVDGDHGASVALDGVQDGVVLGGRADPASTDGAGDRRVVALGPAAGEDHLTRPAPDDLGDPVACLVDRPPRVAGEAVRAARVAEPLGQEREHRLHRFGPHRRRRGVIEVDERLHERHAKA